MKKHNFSLFYNSFYLSDFFRYKKVASRLIWYKKNSGWSWINGQNFGDYLSLVIVCEIAIKEGLLPLHTTPTRLLALGSIIHFAKDGDVIWGSGVNGKISKEKHQFTNLDIRMIRGPRTHGFLQNIIPVNNPLFGDPALLIPTIFQDLHWDPIPGKIIALPNLNDHTLEQMHIPKEITHISPIRYWKNVLTEILTSELVITSSLHGFILSDVFGVPVQLVKPSGGETLFKYHDYIEGTGRKLDKNIPSFADAFQKKRRMNIPPPKYDVKQMLKAFPRDLFKKVDTNRIPAE